MSRIKVTFSPAAARARRADSRPAPGPFTRTDTFFSPCSIALAAALAADRQALAVAEAAVAAEVHQALDVERDLAAQVAFDLVALLEGFADAVDLVVGQVLGPARRIEVGGGADLPRAGVADAVEIGE